MDDNQQKSIFRQESLERLSSPEQLDQLMHVVNPKSWLPLASLGVLVLLAFLWSIFGRITITTAGRGVLVHPSDDSEDLVGLTYFNSGEVARIKPDMEVLLIPDAVGSEHGEGIVGHVMAIMKPPITTLEAVRQNQASEELALQQTSIEVLVELERDPSAVSGYKWSSGEPQIRLAPGIPTRARITIEQKAPITFVFPFLEVLQ